MTRITGGFFSLAFFAFCGFSVPAQAELKVVGTGDGLDMLRAIAVHYASENPGHQISVPPSIGSGGGILAVGSDKERIGRVARPLKQSEGRLGLEYLPIARIPSAIIAHKSVGVDSLSPDQIVALFAGKVRNWSELGGNDLRVKVVRREEDDSTLAVLRATMPGWADLVFTEKSKTALTTQDAIASVTNVVGAVGFGPYSRALEQQVVVLRVDDLLPVDDAYPSAVELALIFKKTRVDTEMKAFIDYSRSVSAASVITTYGGVPIGE